MKRIEIETCEQCKYCNEINNYCLKKGKRINVPFRLEIPDWCPLPDVEEPVFCPHCGKYKRMQGNSILHQLCECGDTSK